MHSKLAQDTALCPVPLQIYIYRISGQELRKSRKQKFSVQFFMSNFA